MENQNNPQLELFSESGERHGLKPRRQSNPLLAYLWNYEKAILIIIGMAITGIISFSLGVEKGKQVSLLKNNSRFDLAAPTPQALRPAQAPAQAQSPTPPQPQPIGGAYTIQLASYKTKTYAQKEAERLKKKGLAPLVLSKGNYVVLCVGNFSDKATAQALLSELKKRYSDCRIRRL